MLVHSATRPVYLLVMPGLLYVSSARLHFPCCVASVNVRAAVTIAVHDARDPRPLLARHRERMFHDCLTRGRSSELPARVDVLSLKPSLSLGDLRPGKPLSRESLKFTVAPSIIPFLCEKKLRELEGLASGYYPQV